jgi:asparagine synthase (glutamine-hydrolysing)
VFEERGRGDFAAFSKRLHDSLRNATVRANPDGQTGAFLSGGLDSSTVAGYLSKVGPPPARTFSIGFGYPDYDELPYARIAAKHFGCQANEYVVSGDDIADSFALIARTYDEPFGNSSALPVYACAKLARGHGVTHLLAGDGGDELFAGNSRYADQRVFEPYARLPAFIRKGLMEPLAKHWPQALRISIARKFCNYVNMARVELPARLESWNLIHRLGAEAFLHPDYLRSVDLDSPFRDMQEVWDSTPGRSTLNQMLWYDWQYTLSDNDLRKVETMGRLAGVRISYPMLDDDVVQLSMEIPPGMKMAGGRLRSFYKDAMADFLPTEIINKKKHGFGLPFGLWLQSSPRLAAQIHDNLAALKKRDIVHPELIDRLMNLHQREDARYYGVFVWVLAMLEQWLQEHRRSLQ